MPGRVSSDKVMFINPSSSGAERSMKGVTDVQLGVVTGLKNGGQYVVRCGFNFEAGDTVSVLSQP